MPTVHAETDQEEETVGERHIDEQNFPDLFGHYRHTTSASIPHTSTRSTSLSPSNPILNSLSERDNPRTSLLTSGMRTVKLPIPPVWNSSNFDLPQSTSAEKRAQRQAERQRSQILPSKGLSPPSSTSSHTTFEKSSSLPVAIEEGLRKLLNIVLNRGQEEASEAQTTRMKIQSSLRGMSGKVQDLRSAGSYGGAPSIDDNGSSDLQLKVCLVTASFDSVFLTLFYL